MADIGPWTSVADAVSALDEVGRPKAPSLPGATDSDRRQGHHLAAIHKMHLSELAMTRRLLDQIEAGQESAASLAKAVQDMGMARNFQTFGNLCGRNCMVINGHHNIEEADTFMRVEAGQNAGINRVVTKLRAEHKVIHALLEQLYEAAVDAVEAPGTDTFDAARRVFEQFEAVVKSHFGYEEVELQEALGVFNAI